MEPAPVRSKLGSTSQSTEPNVKQQREMKFLLHSDEGGGGDCCFPRPKKKIKEEP